MTNVREIAQQAAEAVKERLARKRAAPESETPEAAAEPMMKRVRVWLTVPARAARSGYQKFLAFAAAARQRRAVAPISNAAAPAEVPKKATEEADIAKPVKELSVPEDSGKFVEPMKHEPIKANSDMAAKEGKEGKEGNEDNKANPDDSCSGSESEGIDTDL